MIHASDVNGLAFLFAAPGHRRARADVIASVITVTGGDLLTAGP